MDGGAIVRICVCIFKYYSQFDRLSVIYLVSCLFFPLLDGLKQILWLFYYFFVIIIEYKITTD